MSSNQLLRELEKEFKNEVIPLRFTEHGSECIECEEVNIQLQRFAEKLNHGGLVIRHPGNELLYLNCEGLKYLFPHIARYVVEGDGADRAELAADLVESYLESVIGKKSECLSSSQLLAIRNFALWCIKNFKQELLDFGSTEGELNTLAVRWGKNA